jgi:hypothetical protein
MLLSQSKDQCRKFADPRPIAFDQQGVLTFEVVKPPNMQGHLFFRVLIGFSPPMEDQQ